MKRIGFFTLLLCMAAAVWGQTPTLSALQAAWHYGECPTLQYADATIGDRLLLYKGWATVPLREHADISQAAGTYSTATALQPGDYTARMVGQDGTVRAEAHFCILTPQLPQGKRIVVLGDPHVMSPELVVDPTSSAYVTAMATNRKLLAYSAEIFDAVVDSIIQLHPDLVLITGDMTREGELLSHQYVVKGLYRLKDAGIAPYVVPGNHDMECGVGRAYTENGAVRVENTSIARFRELYHDFGWAEGADFDDNSISYACEPLPGMRLIGIDDCKTYSRGYTEDAEGEYGRIPDATLQWVLQQVDQAVAEEKVPVVMVHHQLLSHFCHQEDFMASASLEQGDSIARVLLDHGVHLALTGHMHIPDISRVWNAQHTEYLAEITTASPVSYPSQYYVLTLDETLSQVDVQTRYLNATASLDDVQLAAKNQFDKTMRSSVRKMVKRYLPAFQRIVREYSNISPEMKTVLQDIPLNSDSLTNIALQAFRPVMEMAIYSHSEGNEHLTMAEEMVTEEFQKGCRLACDLVFDHQDEETKAFLLTLVETQMESRGILDALQSMLTDTPYLGTPDESHDDDLYNTLVLKQDGQNAIAHVSADASSTDVVYNLSGQRMNAATALTKGLYVVRRGNTVKKIWVR